MQCPFCNAEKEQLKVMDSRACEAGHAIRRRRLCQGCGKRFTTYERIEESRHMWVIKRDGQRKPWNRNNVLEGLKRACFKRAVPNETMQRIVNEVEEEVFNQHEGEVASSMIGELVIERLRRVDQVAYVRFASVYRRFKTLEELMEEARAVLDAGMDDNPKQGRLFGEPKRK